MAPLERSDVRINRLRRAQSVIEIHQSLVPKTAGASKHYSSKKMPTTDLHRQTSGDVFNRHRWSNSNYQFHRDWNLHDEYWWDRRYYMSPFYWSHIPFAGRRYDAISPPYGMVHQFPGLWNYPRYATTISDQYHLDGLSPLRFKDPVYERSSFKPWRFQVQDVSRALEMHKQGLIDFPTIERTWLEPSFYRRRLWDKSNLTFPY